MPVRDRAAYYWTFAIEAVHPGADACIPVGVWQTALLVWRAVVAKGDVRAEYAKRHQLLTELVSESSRRSGCLPMRKADSWVGVMRIGGVSRCSACGGATRHRLASFAEESGASL